MKLFKLAVLMLAVSGFTSLAVLSLAADAPHGAAVPRGWFTNLKDVSTQLRADIAELKQELHNDREKAEKNLAKWEQSQVQAAKNLVRWEQLLVEAAAARAAAHAQAERDHRVWEASLAVTKKQQEDTVALQTVTRQQQAFTARQQAQAGR